MSFMAEVNELSKKQQNRSKILIIEEQLGKKDFEEFLKIVDDRKVSCAVIAAVLKTRGVDVSENTLRKVRRSRES